MSLEHHDPKSTNTRPTLRSCDLKRALESTFLPGHSLSSWVYSFSFFFFKYSFNQWFQIDSPKRNAREWASSRVLWLLSQPARAVPDRAEDSHAGADRPAHKGVSSPRQVERGNRGAPRRPDPWAERVRLLRESCGVHAPVSGQAAGPAL